MLSLFNFFLSFMNEKKIRIKKKTIRSGVFRIRIKINC